MDLKGYLGFQEVTETADRVTFRMEARVPMAWLVGEDRLPRKIHELTEVEVPLHRWESIEEETDAIIRVMARAGESTPIRVPNVAALTRAFWAKLRFNRQVCIFNPALYGKFCMPERAVGVGSVVVPRDRILCLGRAGVLGTIVSQSNQRGYILPLQRGVVALHLAAA